MVKVEASGDKVEASGNEVEVSGEHLEPGTVMQSTKVL